MAGQVKVGPERRLTRNNKNTAKAHRVLWGKEKERYQCAGAVEVESANVMNATGGGGENITVNEQARDCGPSKVSQ